VNGQKFITSVKDFQIVNGGRNDSLLHTFKKFEGRSSDVYVQMKLTVIKDEDRKRNGSQYFDMLIVKIRFQSDLSSNNAF
jgi:hypothetical protein